VPRVKSGTERDGVGAGIGVRGESGRERKGVQREVRKDGRGCHQGDFWMCNWLARRRRQRSTDVDVSWLEWSNTESLSNRLMARRNLCLLWSRTSLYAARFAICHLQCQWNGCAVLHRAGRVDNRASGSISRSLRYRRRWRMVVFDVDRTRESSSGQYNVQFPVNDRNRCTIAVIALMSFRRANVTFELCKCSL